MLQKTQPCLAGFVNDCCESFGFLFLRGGTAWRGNTEAQGSPCLKSLTQVLWVVWKHSYWDQWQNFSFVGSVLGLSPAPISTGESWEHIISLPKFQVLKGGWVGERVVYCLLWTEFFSTGSRFSSRPKINSEMLEISWALPFSCLCSLQRHLTLCCVQCCFKLTVCSVTLFTPSCNTIKGGHCWN